MFDILTKFLAVYIAAAPVNPWLSRQKGFVESPQYNLIRQDRAYPAMVLPADINNDGFTDAWVMIQNKQGRGLEFWEQLPLSERHPEVEYVKKCQFDLQPGSELQNFLLENLWPGKAPVALLITKEDSPEEGELRLLAATYNPGRGCKKMVTDKLITRPYLATNEGRKVLALPGNREGYFVDIINGQKTLVREGMATAVTFHSHRGMLDLLLAREQIIFQVGRDGSFKAQRHNIEMAPVKSSAPLKIKENSWAIKAKDNHPAGLIQVAWGCPGEVIGERHGFGTLFLKAGNRKLALPLGTDPTGDSIAAWSNLTGSNRGEPFYQMLFWLKEPLKDSSVQLVYQPDPRQPKKPFCLRNFAIRGDR